MARRMTPAKRRGLGEQDGTAALAVSAAGNATRGKDNYLGREGRAARRDSSLLSSYPCPCLPLPCPPPPFPVSFLWILTSPSLPLPFHPPPPFPLPRRPSPRVLNLQEVRYYCLRAWELCLGVYPYLDYLLCARSVCAPCLARGPAGEGPALRARAGVGLMPQVVCCSCTWKSGRRGQRGGGGDEKERRGMKRWRGRGGRG